MGDQSITWVLDNFSSLQYVKIYSLPFSCGGCDWRLIAYPKGHMNGGYLCLYLEVAFPTTLQSSWRREVKFSLTLVTKALGKPNKVLGGQCFFDTKDHNHWGYREFVSLTKLHDKNKGFLVDDKLVIVADLLVFPPPVAPQDHLVFPALVAPEGKTGNAAKEGSDDDYTCEESSEDDDDDDDSSSVSDDGARDVKSASFGIRANYMNELVIFLEKVFRLPEKEDDLSNANYDKLVDMIHHSLKLDSVETMVNEISDPDGLIYNSTVLLKICICKWRLSIRNLNASEKSEKDGVEANHLLKEASSVKETIDVHGFQVLPSQAESVRRIFEKHPEIALEFRGKNRHLRKAYMSFLLSLIETLCQSLEELSTEDLVEADMALSNLKDAGFKVDWLEKKLEQVVEKKEKEESGLAKLKETEENLLKQKQKCAELDALAEAQKEELSATRTPLSFDDVLF